MNCLTVITLERKFLYRQSQVRHETSEVQKFKEGDFPYNYNGTVKVKTTEKSVS